MNEILVTMALLTLGSATMAVADESDSSFAERAASVDGYQQDFNAGRPIGRAPVRAFSAAEAELFARTTRSDD